VIKIFFSRDSIRKKRVYLYKIIHIEGTLTSRGKDFSTISVFPIFVQKLCISFIISKKEKEGVVILYIW
jgi:hypothetical protein